MTEEEIYKSYKSAKYPKEQIGILADLTLKRKDEIQEIIIRQQTLRAKKEHANKHLEEREAIKKRNELIFKRLDELDAIITSYTEEYRALVNKLKRED